MHEIVQVTAKRGSCDLAYRKSFSSTEEFELNFLQEKYRKGGIPFSVEITSNCGIARQRKEAILKLSGIMEADKIKFYQELAVCSPAQLKKASKVNEGESRRKSIPRLSYKIKESGCKSKPDINKTKRYSEPKSSQTKSNQRKSNPPKPEQQKSNPSKSDPPKLNRQKSSQTNSISDNGSFYFRQWCYLPHDEDVVLKLFTWTPFISDSGAFNFRCDYRYSMVKCCVLFNNS